MMKYVVAVMVCLSALPVMAEEVNEAKEERREKIREARKELREEFKKDFKDNREAFKTECKSDLEKLCGDIKPGGGGKMKCLSEKQELATPSCKAVLINNKAEREAFKVKRKERMKTIRKERTEELRKERMEELRKERIKETQTPQTGP